MTFITGAFSAKFNTLDLGAVEDGFEEIVTPIYEMITADHYKGDLDGVYQGINMMIRCVLLETNLQAVRELIWPWDGDMDGTGGQYEDYGFVGPVGRLLSSFARELILTPCEGSSAQLKGDWGDPLGSITYPRVVISAESRTWKRNSGHQKLPVTLIVLPEDSNIYTEFATDICGNRKYFEAV
jgi:hypothetical protein